MRPWVLIVTGVGGLLVLGLAFKQCGASDSGQLATSQEQAGQLARVPSSERPGWLARSDPEASGRTEGAGPVGERVAGGAQGTTRSERGGVRSDVGATTGGVRSEAGSATGLRGGDRPRSFVGAGSASGPAAQGSLQVDTTARVDSARLQGALAARAGTEQRVVRAGANPAPVSSENKPPDGQPDEEGLLLQMSFDKSTQPDKGDVTPVVEEGISLDETGAKFSTDAQFVIPNAGNIKGEAGTISFFVEPEWAGSDQNLRSLLQLRGDTWENRLQIFKDGPFMRFLFTPDSGFESGAGANIASWQPGERHQVTATWGVSPSGEPLASLYLDGRLAGQQTYDGQLVVQPNTPLFIGSDYQGGAPGAGGTISSLKIYDRVNPNANK